MNIIIITRISDKQLHSRRKKIHKLNQKIVSDNDINYEEIPGITKAQLTTAKRGLGRPTEGLLAKKPISIKLDTHVVARLKKIANKSGIKYQSLISRILANYLMNKPALKKG